jgi:hypothetical protein
VKDSKDSFGKEALDTLIKMVEDHRDDLVVVLAGYPNEMDELMAHNPGVRSRFPTVILFEVIREGGGGEKLFLDRHIYMS